MTTRLTALRLVLLASLAGCDWGTKPGLPTNGQDAASDASGWADIAQPPPDLGVMDDVPPPPDVPVQPADAAPAVDAGAVDAAPPPMDASVGEDCRFTPSRDGETPPAGAVVVDGGYYANDRGEACDPGRGDAGADATDVTDATADAVDAADATADAVTDAVDAADAAADAADGGRP